MRKPLRPGTLVGRVGARAILGLSKQRIHALEDRLPRPVDVVDDKPIWRRRDLERFAEQHAAATAAALTPRDERADGTY